MSFSSADSTKAICDIMASKLLSNKSVMPYAFEKMLFILAEDAD